MSTSAPKSRTGLIIIIVVAIIVIGIVLYIYRDNLFGPNCDPNRNGFDKKGNPSAKCMVENPSNTNTPSPQGTSGWIPDNNFPIRKGSWGPKVKALQTKLGVGADGRFGPITEEALKSKFNKTEITTQAEYDAIVNPKASPVGGNNFDNVKTALGASGTTTSDAVYVTVKGENTPYTITFFTNNRVAFQDNKTKKMILGTYSKGGKTIVIDDKDGGYSTGNWISNSDVFASINNIIAKIEGR